MEVSNDGEFSMQRHENGSALLQNGLRVGGVDRDNQKWVAIIVTHDPLWHGYGPRLLGWHDSQEAAESKLWQARHSLSSRDGAAASTGIKQGFPLLRWITWPWRLWRKST